MMYRWGGIKGKPMNPSDFQPPVVSTATLFNNTRSQYALLKDYNAIKNGPLEVTCIHNSC